MRDVLKTRSTRSASIREMCKLQAFLKLVNKSVIRGFEATQSSEWQDMFLPKKMAEFSNELVTKDDIKLQDIKLHVYLCGMFNEA